VDIWAMGMILYELLHKGKHPLYVYGMSKKQLFEKLR
jgi:hypothetical protein